MIIGLFIVIGLLLLALAGFVSANSMTDGPPAALIALGAFAVVGGVVVGALNTPPPVEETTRVPLAALADSSTTSGSFFLGTGEVDEKRVVRYIFKDEDGWMRIAEVSGDDIAIREDADEEPHVQVVTTALRGGDLGFNFTLSTTYRFVVPPGAVTHDLSFELK